MVVLIRAPVAARWLPLRSFFIVSVFSLSRTALAFVYMHAKPPILVKGGSSFLRCPPKGASYSVTALDPHIISHRAGLDGLGEPSCDILMRVSFWTGMA